jgi:hypothetical protein
MRLLYASLRLLFWMGVLPSPRESPRLSNGLLRQQVRSDSNRCVRAINPGSDSALE